MKVLVTGATGAIGRALVMRLSREGHTVAAWVRSTERARDLLGAGVTLVGRAPRPSAELEAAIADADAIVNLAGESIAGGRWTRKRRRALRDSRVSVTETLVRAMAGAPSRPRTLVSASAVGYYGADARAPSDESAPFGRDFLAVLCRDWEEAARQARDFGVRVVQLRIGIVLDRDGGALSELVRAFRLYLGGRLGDGRQPVSWIHRDDLLEVIVEALHNERIHGPVNAVAPSVDDNRALADGIARRLNRPSWRIPSIAVRASLGRRASLLLGGQRANPRALEKHGFRFAFPTLDEALDDLLGARSFTAQISSAGELPQSSYLAARGANYVLEQRMTIPAPIEEVFEYFSDAGNLAQLTPADLQFSIKTPLPVEMRAGATIDYLIRLGRLPMRWKTIIEDWEPGKRFVDAQVGGPYRSWWHEHRFRAAGNETIMEDRVYYSLPAGVLGRLAHCLFVARTLHRIFAFRARAIAVRFGKRSRSFEPASSTVMLEEVRRRVAHG